VELAEARAPMESDHAGYCALRWRRFVGSKNPYKREQKKNSFRWRFACILVAAWEGQLHTLSFMHSALRVDWLMYRAPSTKEIPFRFFLKAKFASFRSTVTTRCFSETESATGSFSR
jgi:hypothetical protein